ncbi:MAG: hypothetical protein II892_08920 [Fibrobacter sp.]|jgi:hypothetical protein|nr:hypothetical protein [Fibrobacter sp.]
MSKKLILFLCLVLFVAFASAAPKKAAKKAPPKKAVKKTEQVVEEPKKEEKEDDEFISAPEENSATASSKSDDDDDEDEEEDTSQFTSAQLEERLSRQKFEEEQRLDEYANSLRRRDWLKDRLVLQVGMGSRYPYMGETGMGMGFGAGVEYITRWHAALYGSFGFLPKGEDNVFSNIDLEGGFGYKVGLNYYLFPKNPLHLGVSVSYGTVYFDHDIRPDKNNMRPLITVNGYQFDALITYLTNEWYYLQFSFGMYYAPELKSKGLDNPSFDVTSKTDETPVSIVVNPDGMSKTGIVFGIAIGYAFPEFFPDDTEKRRREREKERAKSSRADD